MKESITNSLLNGNFLFSKATLLSFLVTFFSSFPTPLVPSVQIIKMNGSHDVVDDQKREMNEKFDKISVLT